MNDRVIRLEVRVSENEWKRVLRYQGAHLFESRSDALRALVISALDAANIPPIANPGDKADG